MEAGSRGEGVGRGVAGRSGEVEKGGLGREVFDLQLAEAGGGGGVDSRTGWSGGVGELESQSVDIETYEGAWIH